jgi:gamma-glutamyltranspeptidase/glutathione hydrolase
MPVNGSAAGQRSSLVSNLAHVTTSPQLSPDPAAAEPAVATGPPGCAAVAAGSRDTALAAVAVLRAGGNAVDAAIGGMLAASVSELVFTSLGGGGFLNLRLPDGTVKVLDFFVNAPGLGSAEAGAADFTPVVVEFLGATQEFHVGPGSVAVPGALAGYLTAHRDYGRAPLATLTAPAVVLARRGAVVEPVQAEVMDLVREILSLTPESHQLIRTPDGDAAAGDVVDNPALADFLHLVGEGGITSVTSPAYAQPLLDLMAHTAGHVTAEDLRNYEVAERAPLIVERRGAQIALNSPPAFGGAIVAAALERLDPLDGSPQSWVEAARALNEATEQVRRATEAADIGLVSKGTTHISVVDGDGMVATMTTSNGSGSGAVIPGTGIYLNNMLGEEDLHPGGFHALPAGSRLGSMMNPTIVTQPDGTVTGLGSGGSERIRSAMLAALLRVIDLNEDTATAIGAPRIHPDPGDVQLEPGWPNEAVVALGDVAPVNIWSRRNLFFGGVHAVTRHADGSVTAVADPRRDGAVAVVPPRE